MTESEIITLRANIMGGMNEYIKALGDDDIYDVWIRVFPDECDEETLMEMAEDESIWLEVVTAFSNCLNMEKVIRVD